MNSNENLEQEKINEVLGEIEKSIDDFILKASSGHSLRGLKKYD